VFRLKVRFPLSVAEHLIGRLHFRLQQATFEIRRSRWIHTTPLNCRTELELFLDTCRTVQEIEQALKMTQSSDEMQALHRRKKLEDDRRLGVGSDLAGGGSGRGVEKKKVVGEVTTGNMDSDPEDRDEQ
jgi:hypothetical protein